VVQHHALREQLLERLIDRGEIHVAHDLVPEARVQQVQNRVFDAANVLVDRQPVVGARIEHGIRVVRTGVTGVVPARIDESIHRVGFAARRFAAAGASHIQEIVTLQERVARAIGYTVFRQLHGQLVVRHRHRAAIIAMDQRNRAAPVALTGNTPVTQAPLHLLVAGILGFQIGGDGIDGGAVVQTVVLAGVDADAILAAIPFLPGIGIEFVVADFYDLLDRQIVFLGEAKVALVVRRHGHHGAIAVAHQYVVADPDFNLFTGQRVGDEEASRQTFLLHGRHVGFHDGTRFALGDKGGEFRVVLRGVRGKRVLGGHGAEGHAHDGVGAGGEHPQLAVVDQLARCILDLVREGKAHAGALADPVGLHQAHALRPVVQLVEVPQEFFGVLRDAKVVTRDFALFH